MIIEPNETFSFWQLVRWADHHEKYKDGLNLVDGKIVGSYGGGLCQLSNMLFWLFLHTPLTVVERHGHAVESFPSTTEDLPCGTDATINEGWLDLKIRNDTDNTFQIEISFDDKYMYGRILSQSSVNIVIFCILRAKKQPAEGAPLRGASCRPSFILYPYARASRHLNMQTKMLLFCTFGDIIKNWRKNADEVNQCE